MKAALFLAVLGASALSASAISIDGGATWGGWTSVGLSDAAGVYATGATTDKYEVYTTVFSFNNNTKTGSPTGGGPTGGATGFGTGTFSTGAFANGNTILGIGVRRISGAALGGPTVRFDLDNDSYQAASPGPGRSSSGSFSEAGDFNVQFDGAWTGLNITSHSGTRTGSGAIYSGLSDLQNLPSGTGSGVSGDYAFRAFASMPDGTYQMFFDLNAMAALYGTDNPFGKNAAFKGIGTVGNNVTIALNGLGGNNVAFGVNTAVPDGGMTLALLGSALTGLAALRRKLTA